MFLFVLSLISCLRSFCLFVCLFVGVLFVLQVSLTTTAQARHRGMTVELGTTRTRLQQMPTAATCRPTPNHTKSSTTTTPPPTPPFFFFSFSFLALLMSAFRWFRSSLSVASVSARVDRIHPTEQRVLRLAAGRCACFSKYLMCCSCLHRLCNS